MAPLLSLVVFSAFSLSFLGVSAGKIQKPFLVLPSDAAVSQKTVKDAFVSAYGAYKREEQSHCRYHIRIMTLRDHRVRVGAR